MLSFVCYRYISYLYNGEIISVIYISFVSESLIASFFTRPFTRSFYTSDLPLHLNHSSFLWFTLHHHFISFNHYFDLLGFCTSCVFSYLLAMYADYFHFNILIILMMSKFFVRFLMRFFLFLLLLVIPMTYVSTLHCTVVIFTSSAL